VTAAPGGGRSRPIRRRLLLASLAAPALQGCAGPLPGLHAPDTAAGAKALLAESAGAHGMAAFSDIADVSVSYAGAWHALVEKIQPVLVDSGFRGSSQERLLPRDGILAQAQTGPSGHKQVLRHAAPGGQGDNEGGIKVWFNGDETHDSERRAAAALVADGYALFLLGPLLLAGAWADQRSLTPQLAAPERIVVGDDDHWCDVVRARVTPGIGLSDGDDLAVFIDRDARLMRRVRFTVNGLDSTRGAIAEVDTWDHVLLHGVRWPTRFHERLLRPLLLPVHDWRLTGLDVNRGFGAADIGGVEFAGKAAAPAGALPG
jgi:hypothetical protein